MPAKKRPTKAEREADWRSKFLTTLATGRSVTAAAADAGVTRQAAYQLRWRDEDFAGAWVDAEAAAVDYIRDEVYRRAVTGVEEPVYHQGKVVGAVRKFSDTLLIFETKKRDPTYRDSVYVEHSGEVDHRHEVKLLDGRQPIEVEGSARRAAARALLEENPTSGSNGAASGD